MTTSQKKAEMTLCNFSFEIRVLCPLIKHDPNPCKLDENRGKDVSKLSICQFNMTHLMAVMRNESLDPAMSITR